MKFDSFQHRSIRSFAYKAVQNAKACGKLNDDDYPDFRDDLAVRIVNLYPNISDERAVIYAENALTS